MTLRAHIEDHRFFNTLASRRAASQGLSLALHLLAASGLLMAPLPRLVEDRGAAELIREHKEVRVFIRAPVIRPIQPEQAWTSAQAPRPRMRAPVEIQTSPAKPGRLRIWKRESAPDELQDTALREMITIVPREEIRATPAKSFVAPQSRPATREPVEPVIQDPRIDTLPVTSMGPIQPNISVLPGPPPRPFVPPPARARAGAAAEGESAVLLEPPPAVAAVALDTSAAAPALIPGTRMAEVLAGPAPTGNTRGSSAAAGEKVPGLSVRGGHGELREVSPRLPLRSGDPMPLKGEQLRTFETAGNRMLLPLRPGSRVLPRAIEELFVNRVVYSFVLPMPFDPAFPGDWIFWFADSSGEAGFLRPPVPRERFALLPFSAAVPVRASVRLVARLNTIGDFGDIRFLGVVDEPTGRLALESLVCWRFQAATRNGKPVVLDAVIELPAQSSR